MPMFHATLAERLPSIYQHGLGGGQYEQLWEGCERGVYLSAHPEICILVMVEGFFRFAAESKSPSAFIESIRVLVIDDTRYDRAKLGVDPLMNKRDDVFLYRDTIDVRGQTVLRVSDIVPQGEQPEITEETIDFMRDLAGLRDPV